MHGSIPFSKKAEHGMVQSDFSPKEQQTQISRRNSSSLDYTSKQSMVCLLKTGALTFNSNLQLIISRNSN